MTRINKSPDSKIIVLIVLYKCQPSESETINSIINQNSHPDCFQLVIWDNSPDAASVMELDRLKEKIDYTYISKKENVSLSKVYNDVISDFDFDYILLMDQDSEIPKNYFSEISSFIQQYPQIKLFLPIVKNGSLLVSPGEFKYFKGKHWKYEKTGLLSSKNVLAVTSGMLISNQYFTKHQYKFDERLNLYGVDFRFMLQYAQNETSLLVFPMTIAHNSALWSNPSADVLLPRFKNIKKASLIILSDRPFAKILTILHNNYLSLKFAIKYQDFRFLN